LWIAPQLKLSVATAGCVARAQPHGHGAPGGGHIEHHAPAAHLSRAGRQVGAQLVEQLRAHGGERGRATGGALDIEGGDVLRGTADALVARGNADPERKAAGARRRIAIAARVAVDAALLVTAPPGSSVGDTMSSTPSSWQSVVRPRGCAARG
jgi:hypothetical protein